jgi:hypothetical protein
MSLSIANLGDRDTVHVVQCYAEVAGEAVELVHVQRVPVAAGQVVETSATIGATAFARWDAESSRRVSVEGPHTLRIATSSTDPGTSIDVTIVGGRFQSVNGP